MKDNNKTFSKMAGEVEETLNILRDAEQDVEDAKRQLRHSEVVLDNAREAFSRKRDQFHEAFPEMLPSVPASTGPVVVAPEAPAPTPVMPAAPMGPGGPIEFREMDDLPPGVEP